MIPRTSEEAVVEWKFAKEERDKLARLAVQANLVEFVAQEAVDALEDFLVEHCPGATFELGDGRSITIRDVGRVGPRLVSHSTPFTSKNPSDEPNS